MDGVIVTGVCTKQPCSLTSGEYDLQAEASM